MLSNINAPTAQSPTFAPADSPGNETSSEKFSILFLDDEKAIVNSLYRLFRPEGYKLHRANRGEDALAILEAEHIDLIISDMRMPEMDGAEFFSRVAETHPNTVRILLTGYADMESTIKAINEGKLDRYCTKPWNDDDIKMVVRQALETKHMRDEQKRLTALTQSQHDEIVALNASLEEKVKRRTAELEKATVELKEGFKASIKVFTNLTELREPGNPGHNRRVAKRARQLANSMKLDSETTETVYFGALLHDLGKIGLPDKLIGVPNSELNAKEQKEFQKHAEIGHASLMAFEPLHEAAEVIRSHHERFDGKGYPDQLSGEDIPIGARILAVADEFDSLLVGNEYRKPLSAAEAQDYIAHQAGKRFDPKVIDALYEMLADIEVDGGAAQAVTRLKLDDLREGMIIADDLSNDDGVLLLPAGYKLTAPLIDRLRNTKVLGADSTVISVETQSILAPQKDANEGEDVEELEAEQSVH